MSATADDGAAPQWSALRTALEHEHRRLADAAPHRARATPPLTPTRSAPDLTVARTASPPVPQDATVRVADAPPVVAASVVPTVAVADAAVVDEAATATETETETEREAGVCPCCGVRLVLVGGVLREATPVQLPPPRALDPLAAVPAAVWTAAIAVLLACVLAAVLTS